MISTTSAQSTTKAIQTKFVTKHKFRQNKMLSNRGNAEETTTTTPNQEASLRVKTLSQPPSSGKFLSGLLFFGFCKREKKPGREKEKKEFLFWEALRGNSFYLN